MSSEAHIVCSYKLYKFTLTDKIHKLYMGMYTLFICYILYIIVFDITIETLKDLILLGNPLGSCK